jgi:hypothetical protein
VRRIVDLQRRLRERGRIRIGYSVPSTRPGAKPGTKVPKKLDRFRFTTPDADTIHTVSALYGGTPERWTEGGEDQWQVTTLATSVPVAFATRVAFSQSYEQWQGGFLQRICDGETAHVPSTARRMREEDCTCDPDERTCKLTTHLGLILPEIPGLGIWRLVSHGYYAATELLGAVELIEGAINRGLALVPARLIIERREVRRLIDGKPKVHKFAVPGLDLDTGVMSLGSAPLPALGGRAALEADDDTPALGVPPGTRSGAGWRPVDQQALPEAPAVDVAERVAAVDEPKKRRRGSAPALPPTDVKARPASEVDNGICPICGLAYGTKPVRRDPDDRSRYVHVTCYEDSLLGEEPAQDHEAPAGPAAQPTAAGEPEEDEEDEEDGLTHDDEDEDLDELADDDEEPPDDEPDEQPSPPVLAAPPGGRASWGMTHGQHRNVMRLATEAFPATPGATSAEVDDMRRARVLALAALCGQPGLTSRSEITFGTATPLIQALEGIVAGDFAWDEETNQLVDPEVGEPIVFGGDT